MFDPEIREKKSKAVVFDSVHNQFKFYSFENSKGLLNTFIILHTLVVPKVCHS